MITIPFIAITILVGYLFSDNIRKNHTVIYIIFTILCILTSVLRKVPVFMPFYKGFLGLAIFYVVMIIGILNKKSNLYKKLFSIRAELSIVAFIVITPHMIFFIIEKFFGSGKFDLIGLIAYLIMVPLFILSFKKIRAKFQFYQWKSIQNFAYIVYLLIFVHLLIGASQTSNLVLYLILFIPYLIYKPIYYIKNERSFYIRVKENYKKKVVENGKNNS